MVKHLAAAAAASISAAPSSLPFHLLQCAKKGSREATAFESKSIKVLSGKYAMLMHRRYKCKGSMPS